MAEPQGGRPQPRYGEYADTEEAAPDASTAPDTTESSESASSVNDLTTTAARSEGSSAVPPQTPALATPAPATTPAHTGAPAAAGRLPGVPHNLGVSGAAGTPITAPVAGAAGATGAQPPAPNAYNPAQSQPGQGEPYRAAPQPSAPTSSQPHQHAPQQLGVTATPAGATPTPPKRTADRIVSIVLLVLGAFGALNLGFSAMQMPAQVSQAAEIFGIEGVTVPASVSTIGTVGAIIMLAIYAVTLIASIQRLRARKLTFWLPLVAGALAFIAALVVSLMAFGQSPELLQAMADPDATQKMLDYLSAQGL